MIGWKTKLIFVPALLIWGVSGTLSPQAEWSADPHATDSLRSGYCADLHAQVCKKVGVTHDPTGVVYNDFIGEISALRIYQDLTHARRQWSRDRIDREFVKQVYTPARKRKLERIFAWVRSRYEDFIRLQGPEVFSETEKSHLIGILNSVQLDLPGNGKSRSHPELYTQNEVLYVNYGTAEKPDRRLQIGGAFLLTVKSRFNLIFTLAHELSHAIDPCELSSMKQNPVSYPGIISCLENARLFADSETKAGRCQPGDHTSEVFADWIAAGLTGSALQDVVSVYTEKSLLDSVQNSIRDLCDQEYGIFEVDLTAHPRPRTRINQIFSAHPTIQKLLRCEAPAKYLPKQRRLASSPDLTCGMAWPEYKRLNREPASQEAPIPSQIQRFSEE